MSASLDKAKREVDAGNFKAAVKSLWKVQDQLISGGDDAMAPQLLELASAIRERSQGRTREESEILAGYARAVIGQAARADLEAELYDGALVHLSGCRFLAGAGLDISPGAAEACDLIFKESEIVLYLASGQLARFGWDSLDIQIEGAGAIRSGGGFFGGGFGLVGAAAGMLTATALNALTTTTGIDTVIHLQTPAGELFLFYDQETPDALRRTLSPVFVRLRQAAPAAPAKANDSGDHVVDRLHKLADLRDRGAITGDEYALLKANLLAELA